MELNEFIDAIGTPEEWSDVPPTETISVEVIPDANTKKIIGSAATKEEVDRALDHLEQN